MVDPGGAGSVPPYVRARTRVLVSVAAAAACGVGLGFLAPWQVAVLGAWSLGAPVYVVWSFARLWPLDGPATAAHATVEDDSRPVADLLVLGAAVASLGAIGVALVKASQANGGAKAAIIAVSVLAVVSAWAVVHTVFTLRYARLYFVAGGGIEFNDDDDPDYRDFAYFALTIGMTFQVSDTNVTNKAVRRSVTKHAVISYVLGAVVVAMAINVVAGLLNH